MVSNFVQKNEMADKCNNPTCENELVHVEGRRKKKYCSARCRNKISMGNFLAKPKDQKTIRIPVEKYNDLLAKIAENNKPENKERILEERSGIDEINKELLKSPFSEKEIFEIAENSKKHSEPMPVWDRKEKWAIFSKRKQEWHQKYDNKQNQK